MWCVGSRGDYGSIDPPPQEGPAWLHAYDPDAASLVESILDGTHPLIAADAAAPAEQLAALQLASSELRSCESESQPCSLLISNATAAPCELSWIDSRGVATLYATIAPGSCVHGQGTFVGHAWRVSTAQGEPRFFLAVEGLGRVTVSAPPQPAPPKKRKKKRGRWRFGSNPKR